MHKRSVCFVFAILIVGCFAACETASSSNASEQLDGDQAETDADGEAVETEEQDGDQHPDGDDETDADNESDLDPEQGSDGDGEMDTESESDDGDPSVELVCNGFAELCGKRFDEVAYVTTHNAMSNKDEDWVAPNQIHNMQTQLADGVRAFMLDTYNYEGEVWLCHGDCIFGKKKLLDALAEFKAFLERNPGEVITFIFESYISSEDTANAFSEAGLLDYLHAQPTGEPWPTLGDMVRSGRRLVVFTDNPDNGPNWYHDVWDYCWDTPWHVTELDEFGCNRGRGSTENSLFILNHMLYGGFDLPSEQQSQIANSNPFFLERAEKCRDEWGQLPNFVTVDFYSIGDVFDVVDSLNGVIGRN